MDVFQRKAKNVNLLTILILQHLIRKENLRNLAEKFVEERYHHVDDAICLAGFCGFIDGGQVAGIL